MKKFLIVFTILFGNIFYWTATHYALASSLSINQSNYPLIDINLSPENTTISWACFFSDTGEFSGYGNTSENGLNVIDICGENVNFLLVDTIDGLWEQYGECRDGIGVNDLGQCLNSQYYLGVNIPVSSSPPPPAIHYLNIGIGSTSDLMASAGIVVNDIWEIIALAMGLPASFFAIKGVLSLFKR